MEGFISIATYSTEMEAEVAQATLGAAGIESYLKFEDTGGMMPVLQQSEGVQLLVSPANVEEARDILRSAATSLDFPDIGGGD
jgi:hypothetical protein